MFVEGGGVGSGAALLARAAALEKGPLSVQ